MIDHLVGRPNPSWKRTQVFLVILFWLWRIVRGNARPPHIVWLKKADKALGRFSPWQIIVSTLTTLYAVRNFDKLLGLGSPEPLAHLYSPSYYRATWISTGLDAGFATAMTIRPKWLRDVCSVLFSGYYILYANEADEKLRRFRAVPTVEMLRTTWEKTTNPYIRALTYFPRIAVRRRLLLPRPTSSQYGRPITAYLFFCAPEHELSNATDLILDFPGGGFVAMSPEHHEERLRIWAVKTGRPVLSIDYGKAPEYPYPFAIDEAFDAYKVLVESLGTLIGMSGKKLNLIISGDSAGATLAVNVVLKILELNDLQNLSYGSSTLPQPVALVLNYAALDFNFTSWMSGDNLRVLRSEQSSGNLSGIRELANQKDHLQHISPLSMVEDQRYGSTRSRPLKRRGSWKDALRGLTNHNENKSSTASPTNLQTPSSASTPNSPDNHNLPYDDKNVTGDQGPSVDAESEKKEDYNHRKEEDLPIRARVRYKYPHTPATMAEREPTLEKQQYENIMIDEANTNASRLIGRDSFAEDTNKIKEPVGTRLTMTSRTGYFQDRIVSPSMMRAMAILYIGPHRNPDFATDYHISPILAPQHLLAQFPPLLLQCGEKDPFVDDTVIFAGRIREAKRARKVELDLAISGKSTRFRQELKMDKVQSYNSHELCLVEERNRLANETEDDWVQMVLFSDWSHGYLQMPTLMSEAKTVIEELAEWMSVTFNKRTNPFANEGHCNDSCPVVGGTGFRSPDISNNTSETEVEGSGITFVPKKYLDDSSSLGITGGTRTNDSPSPKSMVKVPIPDQHGCLVSSRDENVRYNEGGCRIKSSTHEDEYLSVARTTPQPPGTPKSNSPRQGGTPITETELMRRRRLLDSHIFV
ncbi:Alpha/Beta hydrolase protein [Collybia nuda]|uniref:Alpha/Beta hydrolase protein n=1 Tax=Collybia nuda TaxID=64659 RepID=A0A9P5YJU3_9AGAR|nr:Alpha/Beta hydrolase protein [Collybia nuda]